MNRPILLAGFAGLAGLVLGRALPREAPSHTPDRLAASPPSAVAPLDCNAERAQLASLKTKLRICLAVHEPSAPPEPEPAPSATAAPSAAPSLDRPDFVSTFRAQPSVHVERVLVRHRDGQLWSHRADEWSADRDDGEIVARESPGRPGYFETDAGPVALKHLVGPEGVRTTEGATFIWARPDAGTPTPKEPR